MKRNTACQLNYVISVAYENVEYKKYLENVENKWYNTVKVFVYGVADMNKEKYLVLIDGKDKTEEIEKLEQTEKYYIIKFYNANKTYKYNFSKVVIESATQQIEVKDNQILMIDNIIISNVTKIIKYISKIRIIFSDSREKLTDINKIKLLENNNKSSEKEILNYFKELSKYAKIVDEKTGEERYLLEKQYNKFTVPEKSVLKYYLNGINTEGQLKGTVNIYPFNFNISQKQAVENVNKSNISVIKGPPGTGKIHISMAICNELLKNNVPIIFGTLTQLVEKYAICYRNHTESELTKLYTKVDLLVIDDLGVEPMNDWLLSKLFVIINERLINELPFIITTNYDMKALQQRLSIPNKVCKTTDSIISRLSNMCYRVECKGKRL